MRARLPLCIATLLAWLLLAACGGGGGGGGGERAPEIQPNASPQLFVPGIVTGLPPNHMVVLPALQMRSFVLSATDPDADPLRWQVSVSAAGASAVGLVLPQSMDGTTLLLSLWPVTAAAAARVTIMVEDDRGAATAIDVQIVRTAAPTLSSVEPSSAFRTLPQRAKLHGHGLAQGGLVASRVEFDGVEATDVQVISEQTLTCRTPPDVPIGPASIAVAHPFGTAVLQGHFSIRAFPPVFAPQDRRLGAVADVTGFDLAYTNGRVHAVSSHGLVPTLVYQTSTDGGVNWSTTVAFDGLETPTEPCVFAGELDVGVAWIGDGTAVWFRRPSFPALRLDDTSLVTKRQPRLASAIATWHAAWIQGEALAGTARVFAASSTEFGGNWTAGQLAATGTGNQLDPAIGCSGDHAWIVFADDRLGESARGVYVVRSDDRGATWATPQRLSPTTVAASAPRVCNHGTRVHVAWLQQGGVRCASSPDGGASWGTPVVIHQGAAAAVDHAVACGEELVAFAIADGGTAIQLARMTPGAHVLSTRVDELPLPSADPVVRVVGDHVYVAWREGDVVTGTARVQAAVSGDRGQAFAWRGGFGDGFASQRRPALAHDGAQLVLAWLDDRDGPPFVYTNCLVQ